MHFCRPPNGRCRLAEFDDLFAATLRSIERTGATHARLLLAGDEGLVDRTQRLADAESSCCSFFTFGVSTVEDGRVALDIAVPAAYAEVLAGLVARAEAAQGPRRDRDRRRGGRVCAAARWPRPPA